MSLRKSIISMYSRLGSGAPKYEYLNFKALEDNCEITYIPGGVWEIDEEYNEQYRDVTSAQYSYDKVTWHDFEYIVESEYWKECVPIVLQQGDVVYFRGQITGDQEFQGNPASFYSEQAFEVSGDISTLINGKTNVKVLPYNWIFQGLFYYCENMKINGLVLPATVLSIGCYYQMFYGCRSIDTAPELPATTLAYSCYGSMFIGCTSLTVAPDLPATNLEQVCYHQMFINCTSLQSIRTHFTTWSEDDGCTLNWTQGVTTQGVFYNDGGADIPKGDSGIPYNWTEIKKYDNLTFTAEESNSTIRYNSKPNTTAEYSYNGTIWSNAVDTTITLNNVGDRVMFRGTIDADLFDNTGSRFTMTGKIAASGSVMSMYNGNPNDMSISYNYAFASMFLNCTSLTSSPVLPATSLENFCYYRMFEGCTSLTSVSDLPATNLPVGCYMSMFQGCSSLANAQNKLPGLLMGQLSYASMFQGCSSLISSPEIMAPGLYTSCYANMFNGCSSLNRIVIHTVGEWSGEDYSLNWVKDVAPSGDFYNLGDIYIPTGSDGIPTSWTEHMSPQNTLCFTAEIDNSSIAYKPASGTSAEYTLNGFEWNEWNNETVRLNMGERVYVRGKITSNQDYYNPATFTMSGKIAASNNIMSLYDKDNVDNTTLTYTFAFVRLFQNCNALTSAPELPATTLSYGCYYCMFQNCNALTSAPELPAITLSEECYYCMFDGCSSLTSVPELPAETLQRYCYSGMFRNCTSLVTAQNTLSSMMLAYGCYREMFSGCISLITAPELPATTTSEDCYRDMFYGCTSLNDVQSVLPAMTLSSGCYTNMFCRCSSLTKAPELPAVTLASYCYQYMFRYCTSLTKAPELPATNFTTYCYQYMFQGCSNLCEITVNITSWSTSTYFPTSQWVDGVASTGTFYNLGGAATIPTGTSGIPVGWTVKTEKPGEIRYNATSAVRIVMNELSTTPMSDFFGSNWVEADSTYDHVTGDGVLKFDGPVTVLRNDRINDDYSDPLYDEYNYTFVIGDGSDDEVINQIYLPNTITEIGDYAFYKVPIKTIDIPEGVTKIGHHAFAFSYGNDSPLESITLPSTLTNIENEAFSCVSHLSTIVFPENLEYIGDYAFTDSPFESVTSLNPVPPYLGYCVFCNSDWIGSDSDIGAFYFPADSISDYRDSYWGDFDKDNFYPISE